MSTLLYARLNPAAKNVVAPPSPPAPGGFVTAMAALVPAEVLAVHALIIALALAPADKSSGTPPRALDPQSFTTLRIAFWSLVFLSMLLYYMPRKKAHSWGGKDWIRVLIPPAAFVAWTMLQPLTMFDAICPKLSPIGRTSIAAITGVLLGALASFLSDPGGGP